MADLIEQIIAGWVDDAHAHGERFDPVSLRPALIELRRGYRSGSPKFGSEEARAAYSLAYHPYHAHLMLEVLRRMADVMTFDGSTMRATVYGAGPGAEVCALTNFLACHRPEVRRLEVDLVDAEPGWTTTRERTLVRSVPRWWDGELVLRHHVLDLTSAADIERAVGLANGSALLVAQAVFTELAMTDRRAGFLDQLAAGFGPTALLLVTDFNEMREFAGIATALSRHTDAEAVRSTVVSLPLPHAPEVLQPLYLNADYLRQRRRVKADARAYVRPGWRPPVAAASSTLTPSDDQSTAISALRQFVEQRTADVFVLTGPAGSGKTMVIGEVARHAQQCKRIVTLCAPTGQAARRLANRTGLPAQTVHSALYSSPTTDDRGDEKTPLTRFALTYLGGPSHLMIIDESSLIGDEKVENTDDTDLLFGEGRLLTDIINAVVNAGGQVLFVGDQNQLAPVGSDHLPALEIALLARRGVKVEGASLTKVHRQEEDSDILDLAEGCRTSVQTGQPLPPLPTSDGSAVQQLRSLADAPPWLLQAAWDGEAMVIAARHADARSWITRIRSHRGVDSQKPAPGDRLVLVRGDASTGLLNGDEVTVVAHLGTDTVHHVRHHDRTVTLHQMLLQSVTPLGTATTFVEYVIDDLLLHADQKRIREASNVLYVDFVVRMSNEGVKRGSPEFMARMRDDARLGALYCMYSYARTAHRAQGGEWNVVVCDFSKTAGRGAKLGRYAYTAVTRGRRTLWVSNWPTPAPIDAEGLFRALIGQVRSALEAAGVGRLSEGERPDRNGVTIRLDPDDKSLIVDVFRTLKVFAQKLPSRFGTAEAFQQRFRDWPEYLKPQRPLDENALEWLRPALATLDDQGIETELRQIGDYQMRLTATRSACKAAFDITHSAAGKCKLRPKQGDTDLIAAVEAAMELGK